VRKDSRAEIRSLGMMGAKYVELTPGTPDSPELVSGDVIEGKSASSLSEIMAMGEQVAAGLVDLVNEAKNLILEVRNEYSVKETIQNANGLLTDLRKQTAELGPILKNVRNVSGDGGTELVALLKDVRETNRSVQQKLSTVESELTKALDQAGKGLAEAEGAAKGARTILTSSEDDIASMLFNLNETPATSRCLART